MGTTISWSVFENCRQNASLDYKAKTVGSKLKSGTKGKLEILHLILTAGIEWLSNADRDGTERRQPFPRQTRRVTHTIKVQAIADIAGIDKGTDAHRFDLAKKRYWKKQLSLAENLAGAAEWAWAHVTTGLRGISRTKGIVAKTAHGT